METTRARRATAAGTLAAALLLGACSSSTSGSGGDGRTGSTAPSSSSSAAPSTSASASSSAAADPTEAVAGAFAAAGTAQAVRITGVGVDSGQPLKFDMHYGKDSAQGYLEIHSTRIQLLVVGTTVYFQAPDSFWRQQAGAQAEQVIPLVHGKWVKVPKGSSAASSFDEFANRQKVLASFTDSLRDEVKTLKPAGTGTVAGVATNRFTNPATGDTVDVASSGKPYLVRVVDATKNDGGTLDFTQWDQPFTATAPPASKTFTLPS